LRDTHTGEDSEEVVLSETLAAPKEVERGPERAEFDDPVDDIDEGVVDDALSRDISSADAKDGRLLCLTGGVAVAPLESISQEMCSGEPTLKSLQ
jgi:hypothetical protein